MILCWLELVLYEVVIDWVTFGFNVYVRVDPDKLRVVVGLNVKFIITSVCFIIIDS